MLHGPVKQKQIHLDSYIEGLLQYPTEIKLKLNLRYT